YFLEQRLISLCIPYKACATVEVMISTVPDAKIQDGCFTRYLRSKSGSTGHELGLTACQALEVFQVDGVAVHACRCWGRGAVKLAPLRPRSGGERGAVKLAPLRRRSRGGRLEQGAHGILHSELLPTDHGGSDEALIDHATVTILGQVTLGPCQALEKVC